LDVASAQDDLAVLEVGQPQGLALSHAPIVLGAQLPRGTWVWNIGIGQKWDMPDRAGGVGPIDVVTGLRRVGSLRTPPGASGGAGVTESGVIGIVLEDASDSSWLLPIERIRQLFEAWELPVNLLTSTPSPPGSEGSSLSQATQSKKSTGIKPENSRDAIPATPHRNFEDVDNFKKIVHLLPGKGCGDEASARSFLNSTSSAANMYVGNGSKEDVVLYWVNYGGTRSQRRVITSGEETVTNTFSGHTWVITYPDGRCRNTFTMGGETTLLEVDDN
jgi:hypothetical protein